MEEALKPTKEAPQIVNVFPITKGKRVLLFLADFFICFIISFLLFNLATYPIGYVVTKYADVQENADKANLNINYVLSGNELVYFKDESKKENINEALSYTFDLYMKDMINGVSSDNDNSHDVFYAYYVTKQNNKDRYYSLYNKFNEKYNFFAIDKNAETISFTAKVTELLEPLKVNKEALSDDGASLYEDMFNRFFLTYYSQMLMDIKIVDLSFNGISYVKNQQIIENANSLMDKLLIISSIISFVLGWAICYILIPLVNQYRKTLGMLMMRIHRIDIHSMKILSKKQIAAYSIYSVFTNLMALCFLPLLVMSVEYIFNLTFTLWLSVASLVIVLASLIVLLFSKSNQTLCDGITRSAYISNDSLDEIYRARGYYI